MSTTVWYNGVELRECETKSFNEEVFFDESHTDRIGYKFRIAVASTMVFGPGSSSSGDPLGEKGFVAGPRTREFGDDLGDKLRAIHRNLSAPRADFYYIMETVKGVPGANANHCIVRATGSIIGQMEDMPKSVHDRIGTTPDVVWRERYVDINNGPTPISVKVTDIFSGNAVRVEFEIEVSLIERMGSQESEESQYPVSLPPNMLVQTPSKDVGADAETTSTKLRAVLSNRWSMSETRNENWAIERTITGLLRIKHQQYLAHSMRYLCFPGLEDGYQRKSITFTDDPTGLNLRYTIVDAQKTAAPPPPATNWSGVHSQTTSLSGETIANVRLRLEGPPGVDKKQLFGAAGWVMSQRIPGLQRFKSDNDPDGNPYPVTAILENVGAVNVITEPVVELNVTVRLITTDDKSYGVAMEDLLKPIDVKTESINVGSPAIPVMATVETYSPKKWPAPLPFPTDASASLVAIFSCYLQNPASPWHAIPKKAPPQPTYTLTNSRNYRETETPPDTKYYRSETELVVSKKDQTKLTTEQLTEKPVTFVFISNTYSTKSGVVSLPRAFIPPKPDPLATPPVLPQDTCSFAQLHGGQCFRHFHMEITRTGANPQMVEPTEMLVDINGITERLVSAEQKLVSPELTRDAATRKYTVVCDYVYALSRPPTLKEKLRIATSPIDKLLPEDALLDQEAVYTKTDKIEWRPPVPPPT
jgi:hypothetical protein